MLQNIFFFNFMKCLKKKYKEPEKLSHYEKKTDKCGNKNKYKVFRKLFDLNKNIRLL